MFIPIGALQRKAFEIELSGLRSLRVVSLGGDSAMDVGLLRRLRPDVPYLHGAMPAGAATSEGLSPPSASGTVTVAPGQCVRLRDRR